MLSNTSGFGRSAVQGYHKSDNAKLLEICPHVRRLGKCATYNKEQQLRRTVALAKEKELVSKATGLYTLQLDLLASTTAETGGDLAEAQALLRSLSARGAFSPEASKKKEMIDRLVAELKQEPAYQHWNLEAEVAAEMVRQRMRHCPFSHQEASLVVLKRDRAEAEKHDAAVENRLWKQLRLEGGDGHEGGVPSVPSVPPQHTVRRLTAARARWTAERLHVFNSLTVFQKCVCCLLWQQTVCVPQRLLKDVRRALEQEVQARGTWPGRHHAQHGEDEDSSADEEAMEAYLQSDAFDKRVEAEEARLVDVVVCRPELGVVDLSAMPNIIVHASEKSGQGLFTASTIAYFTQADEDVDQAGDTAATTKTPPATATATTTRSLIRGKLTTKELDVSETNRADELAEALEWMSLVFNRERALRAPDGGAAQPPRTTASAPQGADDVVVVRPTSGRHVWRSLAIRRADLTQAESLVKALHKRGLERNLLALDLSDNRLTSLRFLFYLRAHYGHRLLRLSLKNNLITRKPEYQEQVRLSLPKLTSLDGAPIRRPPMLFPRPRPDSFTLSVCPTSSPSPQQPGGRDVLVSGMTAAEARTVLDCLARLCYIWETRRIPHTEAERRRYAGGRAALATNDKDDHDVSEAGGKAATQRRGSKVPSHVRTLATTTTTTNSAKASPSTNTNASDAAADALDVQEPEQDLDEDNFPHRYLHPSATYSFTATPDLVLFDPVTMRLNREVELDDSYQGMRLNADDVKAVRVFDVAVRNSSRNLLQGRPALQRTVRGAPNCYLAYQLTLYPESLAVDHHLDSAVISILKIKDTRHQHNGSSKAHAGSFGGGAAHGPQPTFFLVTVHGVITWRAPSMRGSDEQLTAAYERTLTFVEKVFPAQNRAWEKLRSPKLVLYNDNVLLRPHRLGDPVCYTPSTFARLARLVVEFGLEACVDGIELVRRVMELARTDAAEHAALDALVFGPPPPVPPETPEEAQERKARHAKEKAGKLLPSTFDRASADAAVDAVASLVTQWIARLSSPSSASSRPARKPKKEKALDVTAAPESSGGGVVFHVVSLLDRPVAEAGDAVAAHSSSSPEEQDAEPQAWGGSHSHDVPLAMLREVVATCNAHYAALKML